MTDAPSERIFHPQGSTETTARGIDFEDWKPFIIYRCVVGSQAFGLSGDDSDVDHRGFTSLPRSVERISTDFRRQIRIMICAGACVAARRGRRAGAGRDGPGLARHRRLKMEMGDSLAIPREMITGGAAQERLCLLHKVVR
jgi:hypothetical protein